MRSQDLHMAATVYMQQRQVLITGSIDQNDQNLIMRIDIPAPGIWTFIKAETNLTTAPWYAWQITMGDNVTYPTNPSEQLLQCRQFQQAAYLASYGAIMFSNGEVRPGEPILKIFNLNVVSTTAAESIIGVSVSHSRLAGQTDPASYAAAVNGGFGEQRPNIEIVVPTLIVS